jgi:hypothetical protein
VDEVDDDDEEDEGNTMQPTELVQDLQRFQWNHCVDKRDGNDFGLPRRNSTPKLCQSRCNPHRLLLVVRGLQKDPFEILEHILLLW